jgi:hypothetical protein
MKDTHKHPSDWELIEALESLKEIPPREPGKAKAGKDAFMFEVAKVRATVSPRQESRHTGWIENSFFRKETRKMTNLGTIILILSLILGGSGITAVSAQNSLPDSNLYPVKLLTEDIQYVLTADPLAKWQLSLQFTEQRMEEIRMILTSNSVPSEAVLLRLNTRLMTTVHLASGLGDPLAAQALAQTQARLEIQSQLMQQMQVGTPLGEALQERVQEMIQERIRQTQTGQQDPLQLQQQLQQQIQQQLQLQNQTGTPTGTQYQYQYQYSTPQMPEKTRTKTPMGCLGQGQCGNNK